MIWESASSEAAAKFPPSLTFSFAVKPPIAVELAK